MKSFYQHIRENTTANMTYLSTPSGAGFAKDRVPSDFDVEDFANGGEDGEERDKMKPWEVRNADEAAARRSHLMQWMKSATMGRKEAVNAKSLPLVPTWQSRIR